MLGLALYQWLCCVLGLSLKFGSSFLCCFFSSLCNCLKGFLSEPEAASEKLCFNYWHMQLRDTHPGVTWALLLELGSSDITVTSIIWTLDNIRLRTEHSSSLR